jgi:hypothetical protein
MKELLLATLRFIWYKNPRDAEIIISIVLEYLHAGQINELLTKLEHISNRPRD